MLLRKACSCCEEKGESVNLTAIGFATIETYFVRRVHKLSMGTELKSFKIVIQGQSRSGREEGARVGSAGSGA